MKALILAAGFGKRLQPLTNMIPKSMVPVKGVPLIVRSMHKIQTLGVSSFVLVTGHKADYIQTKLGCFFGELPVVYILNPDYETTNNIYSLWLAADKMDDDICLFECDLLYSEQLLQLLSKSDADCTIVTSDFNSETMDGSVIQVDAAGNALDLYLKKEQYPGFDYSDKKKTVNIYKFSKRFLSEALVPALKAEIDAGNLSSYYESVLKDIMKNGRWDIKVLNVPESLWCEIDDHDDLARAEESGLL